MKRKESIIIVTISVISILVLSSIGNASSLSEIGENPNSGAYVNKVIYHHDANPDSRILSLMGDYTDALLDAIDPIDLEALMLDPDCGVHTRHQNYYLEMMINCRDYPLNISGLRRAFAYAFDKTQLTPDYFGHQTFVHDSVIPRPSSFCVEDDLPWHYYSNQSDVGNQILDSLNFTIDGETGYRLAPDGTPFTIDLEYFDELFYPIGIRAVRALKSLSIDAVRYYTDVNDLLNRVDNHGAYDMAIFERNFYDNYYADWLADWFWSDYADVAYRNPTNFVNESFDQLRDQLVNGSSHEEVLEAASQMQHIIHENVPVLILYGRQEYQGYRVTDFTGHIEDKHWGITGPWTNVKVHRIIGSPFGSNFEIAMATYPDSLNLFLADDWSEDAILSNLYSSLFKVGPDQIQYPDLATSILRETHDSNPSVPVGQTWITLEMRTDAVWSDGQPLTAEDVVATFTYLNESAEFGNLMSSTVGPYYMASEVLTPSTVKIVFGTQIFREIQEALAVPIIPGHIFNNETGIGYADWNTWNPVFGTGPHVTCGPFYLSDHDSANFELTRNLDYHWLSGDPPKVLEVSDITYIVGTTGHQIVWQVEDEDPHEYTIFQNGTLVGTYEWNGDNITVSVDGLSAGVYNYTLQLSDYSRHIVTSMVWVTVVPQETSETGESGEPPDFLVLGIAGTVGVIILVIGFGVYKKR